jgi:hypothetical protein
MYVAVGDGGAAIARRPEGIKPPRRTSFFFCHE